MKKWLLSVIVFTLCISMVGCSLLSSQPQVDTTPNTDDATVTEPVTEPTEEPVEKPVEKKSFDLYIIAGQSNAAGFTTIDEEKLATLWADYKEGSPNVLYMGVAAQTNFYNNTVGISQNKVSKWTNAKAGQGKSTSCMGPEVGMAAVLSQTYYTEDRMAGFVKYAHGGTSILNKTNNGNAGNGNWVCPTYAKQNGLSYMGLTGNLYRRLLATVKDSVNQLKSAGYNDIHVKGIFWMQGEEDVNEPNEYKAALKLLIADLRNDLSEITGDDPESIAFMIGEISETFEYATATILYRNRKFIEAQRQVATDEKNVYVIASGQYQINWTDIKTGENKYGQDRYHWITEPMFHIGEMIAQCILENVLGYQTE